MRANIKLGGITIGTSECDNIKELFTELAKISEVFGDRECGLCRKENLVPVLRTTKDGFNYFELHCLDCTARLSFGQSRDEVSLWAKREKQDGTRDQEHKGWYIYTPDTQQQYSDPQQPAQQQTQPAQQSAGTSPATMEDDVPF